MARPRPARIQDLVSLLHALYPPDLAEEWDNVGLQLGDPAAPVERVLVALDPSAAAVEEARTRGAAALVTHHPLFFRPLRSLTPQDETGAVALRAIQAGVAIMAAHTNLDAARDGLNDWLAARLGLQDPAPLAPGPEHLLKLAVYVPFAHADAVAEALFAGGAGTIGAYDRCAFRVAGSGSFRPGPGATPFVGEPGRDSRVEELRIETVVPRRQLPRVLEKMRRAHPYEEVAFDLYPLANRRTDVGLGRIGTLAQPLALELFAARVREALATTGVRVVGAGERPVARVAVCTGSGAGLLGEAARQGADVLVTGDLKYHEARQAEARGLAVIDAGHFGTERIAVSGLVEALAGAAASRTLKLEFEPWEGEQDPFRVIC